MRFFTTSLSSLLLCTIAAVNAAAAKPPGPLDVWSPKITYPTEGTVWESKTEQTLTWDVSDAPPVISNGALLMLRQNDITAPFILAKGFDLRAGNLTITVPYVLSNPNYQLVLFGDSGNFGPVFTINSDV
ncbi:hypothetical protein R3P38DRAFT_2609370 [Favolaschia claudopus]|uniref:Yeast cell wall synthesis Kre9/Knh1-like N-terminal domain-containing protein n=1 Tax=Favolaschia claudopus TaxID=2862362 RepID=A0AAW0D336_9AGAR